MDSETKNRKTVLIVSLVASLLVGIASFVLAFVLIGTGGGSFGGGTGGGPSGGAGGGIGAGGKTHTHTFALNSIVLPADESEGHLCLKCKCGVEYNELTTCRDHNHPVAIGSNYQFGKYPMSKVEKELSISYLNSVSHLDTKNHTVDKSLWKQYHDNWSAYQSHHENVGEYYYIDLDVDSNGTYDYRGLYAEAKGSYLGTALGIPEGDVAWFRYEPIVWNRLTTTSNSVLLVTDLIIDHQVFNPNSNQHQQANYYSKSNLRTWLLNQFYNLAFKASEKEDIYTGDNTYRYENDPVFILSSNNMNALTSYGFESQTVNTAYSRTISPYNDYWTSSRTTGNNEDTVIGVNAEGTIGMWEAFYDNYGQLGVRPSVVIKN